MAIDGSTNTASKEETTGFVVEIVEELFARADINYTLELVPWKRAYDKTLSLPNHGVFITTRTPEREELFSWVSPLVENNWVFMGRADSDITLSTLQDANDYRVGGYLEDAIATYLESNGININYVANDILNLRKLVRGRIDLWPVVRQKGHWLAKSEGVDVKEIVIIKPTQADLAMNKDTDPEIIARLNQAMSEIRADGTVLAITQRFLSQDGPSPEDTPFEIRRITDN